jgi:hypothetical protein
MDAKTAVHQAKNEIQTLFGDEGIKNLGLEEIIHDDSMHIWRITIGFSRAWDEPRSASLIALANGGSSYLHRTYKVVSINEDTTQLVSITALEDRHA